ncbi:hypothetical protein EJ08DRAFT_726303 [Tothia fuscella]|uniref:Uncharacterized protein n=1 Tax=Tothia fuscella TaxID=1048955 RepID=A0A9P4NI41_9PEZI|nr:hypothetical protein EJ08DRAFT_726303 [Tothia fuscella]
MPFTHSQGDHNIDGYTIECTLPECPQWMNRVQYRDFIIITPCTRSYTGVRRAILGRGSINSAYIERGEGPAVTYCGDTPIIWHNGIRRPHRRSASSSGSSSTVFENAQRPEAVSPASPIRHTVESLFNRITTPIRQFNLPPFASLFSRSEAPVPITPAPLMSLTRPISPPPLQRRSWVPYKLRAGAKALATSGRMSLREISQFLNLPWTTTRRIVAKARTPTSWEGKCFVGCWRNTCFSDAGYQEVSPATGIFA